MNPSDILEGYISDFSDQWKELLTSGKREDWEKGKHLLREGEICKKLFFVEKGALRFYYNNEEGKDITHWFLFENDIITEINSFLGQEPSKYFLETLEDSVVYTFPLEEIIRLTNGNDGLQKLWIIILSRLLIDFGEKVKDLQFRDAKTRYANLISKYPKIEQRVSLGDIASYLGITQQSFSRIRKEK